MCKGGAAQGGRNRRRNSGSAKVMNPSARTDQMMAVWMWGMPAVMHEKLWGLGRGCSMPVACDDGCWCPGCCGGMCTPQPVAVITPPAAAARIAVKHTLHNDSQCCFQATPCADSRAGLAMNTADSVDCSRPPTTLHTLHKTDAATLQSSTHKSVPQSLLWCVAQFYFISTTAHHLQSHTPCLRGCCFLDLLLLPLPHAAPSSCPGFKPICCCCCCSSCRSALGAASSAAAASTSWPARTASI